MHQSEIRSEIIHICQRPRKELSSQTETIGLPLNYQFSLQKLRENIEEVPYNNRQLTLIMGKTKAGKSTLFNLLIGHEMQRVTFQSNKVVLEINPDSQIQFSEIRHDRNRGTAQPQYQEVGDNIFVDCPGLDDNESQYDEIRNSMRILQLQKSNTFKIILVMDYNTFNSDAGYFSQTFNQIADSLATEIETFSQIGIIFTKAPTDKDIIQKIRFNIEQDFLNHANRLRSNAKLLLIKILQTKWITVYKQPEKIRLNPRLEEIQLREFVQSIPYAPSCETIHPIISTNSLSKLESMFANYNNIIKQLVPSFIESIKQHMQEMELFKQIMLWINLGKSCTNLTTLVQQLQKVISNSNSFKLLSEIHLNFKYFNCFPTVLQVYSQIDLTKFQTEAEKMVNNLMDEQSRLVKRLQQEMREHQINQQNNSDNDIQTQLANSVENGCDPMSEQIEIDDLFQNSIIESKQHEIQINEIANQHPVVSQAMQIKQYRKTILKYTIIGMFCGLGIALIPIGGAVILLSVPVTAMMALPLMGGAFVGSVYGAKVHY